MENGNNKIYVLRGNLNEKKLNSLSELEGFTILVTGKVAFKSEVIVPCGLIAIGDLEATKLTVKGSLACEGRSVVEELNVEGDLSVVQKGTEIKKLNLSGRLISERESIWLEI